MDDASFVRQFARPALVFLTGATPASDEPRVDTPSNGVKLPGADFGRTNALKTTDAFPVVDETMVDPEEAPRPVEQRAREVIGASLVVFLEKSGRNPFESMITIGRTPNNDHCIPLPSISKVHAYFSKTPSGDWRITDQKSTNGTSVDGRRLEAGGSASVVDGTRIDFGPDARSKFFTPLGLYGFIQLYRSGVTV
jgi:hypothetical protein